jgi:hypothetical protein
MFRRAPNKLVSYTNTPEHPRAPCARIDLCNVAFVLLNKYRGIRICHWGRDLERLIWRYSLSINVWHMLATVAHKAHLCGVVFR